MLLYSYFDKSPDSFTDEIMAVFEKYFENT